MRFLAAVEKIGLRTAVPRTILQVLPFTGVVSRPADTCGHTPLSAAHPMQVMDVEGLTRENIASHLQKYRRLLEKKAGISGPVTSKDWPELEAVQTQHLQSLRKQVSESQDAQTGTGATAAPAGEQGAAVMQPVSAAPVAATTIRPPTTDAAAPSAPTIPAPVDGQTAPPPVATTPDSADLPAESVPGMDMMWQVRTRLSGPHQAG